MPNDLTKQKQTTLPVTFDKSHVVTIGEKLYSESIELIRELVNNAYDADATEVKITFTPDSIKIEDNGTGMNLQGLKQYFNIGSPEKALHTRSPIYNRVRIGQFGIGKFATLSACDRFEVLTQQDDFSARVIFDKQQWARDNHSWELPMTIYKPDEKRGDGTTVILSKLNRVFDIEKVTQRIRESVPLKVKNFSVFVNGRRVMLLRVPGHRMTFLEGTEFGAVYGDIVIVPASRASAEDMGIEVRVKGVMVRRELFGIQTWGKDAARIRGEVNADFLPITSGRSGFIIDSPEYQALQKVMAEVMRAVKKQLGLLTDKSETTKVKRALKEALERLQRAITLNPDFGMAGTSPIGEETDGLGEPAEVNAEPVQHDEEKEIESAEADESEGKVETAEKIEDETSPEESERPPKKPLVKRLTPNAVVRKIRTGEQVVACCLDHFGADGPECFTEGQIIYINREHPLYKRESKSRKTHTMYLARLLTQELSLMRNPMDPRHAFEQQSKLLKDAFVDS